MGRGGSRAIRIELMNWHLREGGTRLRPNAAAQSSHARSAPFSNTNVTCDRPFRSRPAARHGHGSYSAREIVNIGDRRMPVSYACR